MLGHHGISEAAISSLAELSPIVVHIGVVMENDEAFSFTPVLVPAAPELPRFVRLKASASVVSTLEGGRCITASLTATYRSGTVVRLEASWSTFVALRGSIH